MVVLYVCCGIDRKAELKKLNRSILVCFLELLDVLIDNPASPAVSAWFTVDLVCVVCVCMCVCVVCRESRRSGTSVCYS